MPHLYTCVDCDTTRFIIFPNRDESLTICSSCYRIRIYKEEKELEKKKEDFLLLQEKQITEGKPTPIARVPNQRFAF